MLPPEFDTPSFCKKSQDPVCVRDENSSMHFAGQVARFASQSSESSVNVLNHEPNSSIDASSMTFAIGLSLGLDESCLSHSTNSPILQYEALPAEVAPTELSRQAELPASSDQCPPSEQSVSQDARFAFIVQNTSTGVFEICQPVASSVECAPTTQIIAGNRQTYQNEPTELVTIWIVNEQQQQQSASNAATSANPTSPPKIAGTNEPSSKVDQLPTSVQPIPAIVVIPLLETQNQQVDESHPKPAKKCGKEFSSNGNPRTHPRTNSDETRHTCDICDKTFPTGYNLARHKWSHTGEKKFACDICHKSFAERYVFARHMATHTGQKKFTCDICNKSFPTSYNLARHRKTHTAEKKFACDVCHESFTENYLFKKHMTIHNGKKKFACDFCNETFTKNGSLARHMRRHNGEKTFPCHVCDKKFARKDYLKRHMKTHAVEKNRVSRNDIPPAQTASVDVVEEQQACIDFSAYPNLVASDATIPVCVNTAEVEIALDLRKHTIDSLRRPETLVR